MCCCCCCCLRCCTGKTTLLRYLLENSKEKVACIVNDVASINIDAKLVRNDRNRSRGEAVNTTADLADTIELANGCACEWLGRRGVWVA
jgi:G3E family GTPase